MCKNMKINHGWRFVGHKQMYRNGTFQGPNDQEEEWPEKQNEKRKLNKNKAKQIQ